MATEKVVLPGRSGLKTAVAVVIVSLFLGCPLEEPPTPKAEITVEAVSPGSSGMYDVVLSVANTGKEVISRIDFSIQVNHGEHSRYRRVIDSVVVPPGSTIGVIETFACEEDEEIPEKENIRIMWVSVS